MCFLEGGQLLTLDRGINVSQQAFFQNESFNRSTTQSKGSIKQEEEENSTQSEVRRENQISHINMYMWNLEK